MPKRWDVTPSELAIMNGRAQTSSSADAYYSLLKQKGAVKVGSLDIVLNLEGRWSETVRIDDVTPVALDRQRPVAGTLVCDPAAGSGNTERMHFDLDDTHPLARVDKSGHNDADQPYFANRSITLQQRELATVHITASTTRSDVRFRLAVSMTAGTQHQTLTVDQNGSPFEVSAAANGGPLTIKSVGSYQNAYIVETGATVVPVAGPVRLSAGETDSDAAC